MKVVYASRNVSDSRIDLYDALVGRMSDASEVLALHYILRHSELASGSL